MLRMVVELAFPIAGLRRLQQRRRRNGYLIYSRPGDSGEEWSEGGVDNVQKSPTTSWSEHGVFQHIREDGARAFVTKPGLVTKYHLRGYSVREPGLDDARTWKAIQ